MGPPPVVTGISPKEGPPGTRVTIRGEFLGISSTDLIGLIICGCDCLLSAEWKSKNKIVARSGPCKGRGDIIVTTKSGGEGTSTVQFRGYHESIGPVKESAVWVEETAPPALPWGRRPLSPAACAPPDPLGLSTEGDDCNFPEEHLLDYFPDGSGKLTDDNFQPGWYLLEHHSNTSFEDLRAGMVFLQRKVESQKEGQISFLKANTGAVMDQLDRLVLLKNMYEEDQRKSGKEPLPSLQTAIEESIAVADALFAEILARKESADRTRDALLLLTRHRFLFQLPASVDRNIRRNEFDLVVNDYSRVNNLFGNTHVQLFKKILTEIDKKIKDLKENLYTRMKTMPIHVQEQTKYIRLLISLNWEGDAAWVAITSRKEYLLNLLNKVKDYFKNIEDQEISGKRKWKEGEGEGAWSETRAAWCAAACGALAAELAALWPLARRYFAGELAGEPDAPTRHNDLKEMIIAAVELFASHMRVCLLSGAGGAAGAGGAGGAGGAPADAVRARLAANLRNLREAYDSLLKLDLPSQPLSIVEKVIFEYRAYGMTVFLQRALRRVEGLARLETWCVRRRGAHPAVTDLPMMLETAVKEALGSIDKCVLGAGRREGALLLGKESPEALQRLARQILLAFVSVLRELALSHADQDFVITSLSVLLTQRAEEPAARPGWQQRLLIAGANAQYVRLVTLPDLVTAFESYKLPISSATTAEVREELVQLERSISETYLEQTGDALVGTIEASMHLGRQRLPRVPSAPHAANVPRASPYIYEIINNLIAVHAEVDSVSSVASATYVRAICETVCEELARLAAGAWGGAGAGGGAALQARLDAALLRLAARHHLTRKAENDLKEALARFPPLETEDDKKLLESLVADFKKEMELQLTCLSCNAETI